MNRAIRHLGSFVLFIGLLGVGCAAPQDGLDDDLQSAELDRTSTYSSGEMPGTSSRQKLSFVGQLQTNSEDSASGPVPDPWTSGPVPDPWTSGPVPDPWANKTTPAEPSPGSTTGDGKSNGSSKR